MIILSAEDKNISDILNLIDKEIIFISSSLTMQENLSTQILRYFKKLASNINLESSSNDISNYSVKSKEISKILDKANSNIELYKQYLEILEKFKNNIEKFNMKKILDKIKEYNDLYTQNNNQILSNINEIEVFLQSIIQDSENALHSQQEKLEEETKKENVEENIIKANKLNYANYIDDELDENGNFKLYENTLIISEVAKVVILPYTKDKLEDILNANKDKYSDIYDVIDKIYTVPLKKYKYQPVSRFKEAYRLARNKEKMSIKGALELGCECFFNTSLHPAIITACDNLNQLDIYLSCLDYDELDDFKFFTVIFKIPPLIDRKPLFNFNISKRFSLNQ